MLKWSSRAVAAALITAPFMGLPAWGAPCVTAPVSVYTESGFSCSVADKTFSNIVITATSTGNASTTLSTITPFISGNELGLQLNFLGIAGQSPPTGASDIAWSYNVVSPVPIIDAFLQVVGNTTGTGQILVNEQLTNLATSALVASLSLTGPGITTATFAPVFALHVLKDAVDFSGAAGFATSSILVNAFSQVPGPIVGAGLPGLVAACGCLLALVARRRRRQYA